MATHAQLLFNKQAIGFTNTQVVAAAANPGPGLTIYGVGVLTKPMMECVQKVVDAKTRVYR